jgi:hypothetical protein
VLPVQGHQPLAGDQPQPQEDRDRGVRDILTGAPSDVEVGLLQDVGGIDPPLEPPIEPQPHDPPQPIATPGEERDQRSLIATLDALEQVIEVAGVGDHGRAPP